MAATRMTQFGTWQPKIRGKLFYNWPQGACEEALRFTSAEQLGVESCQLPLFPTARGEEVDKAAAVATMMDLVWSQG